MNIKSPLAYISEQIADLKLRSLGSKKRAVENTSVLVGTLCFIFDTLSQPVVHVAPFFFFSLLNIFFYAWFHLLRFIGLLYVSLYLLF